MSQVAKTKFIAFAFIFSTTLLSGCGISGPLYMPGSAQDPDRDKAPKVVTPVADSVDTEDTATNEDNSISADSATSEDDMTAEDSTEAVE